MPTLTEDVKSQNLMSVLLKQVYETVTNGGDPEQIGPHDFIAFDPVGKSVILQIKTPLIMH